MAKKFKTPLRRRLLNNLNRQRKSLLDKGANLRDIDYLFKVNSNKPLSTLNTTELKNISKNLDNIGKKTVLPNGTVTTQKFIKKVETAKSITGLDMKVPNTIEKQVNHKLSSFSTPKQVENHYKKRFYNEKKRYVERIKSLDKTLGNKIDRMSLKDFDTMIKQSGGLASFDRVFINSPKNLPEFFKDDKMIADDELSKIDEVNSDMLSDVNHFYNLVKRGKK